MNVLSLFDGISCGRVALERAGIKVGKYYASEIDKYAIQISKKNWPDIIQLGDVTRIDTKSLPKIDLLIAGSPCQGFSFAGKQLNFNDERSALFFDFVKILKEIKPKYFLLENVRMKKEYQDVISEYLGVSPVLIDSELISPAYRKRLYWANFPIVQPDRKEINILDYLEKDATGLINVSSSGRENYIETRFTESDKALTLTATGYTRKSSSVIACTIGSSDNRKFRLTEKFGCLTATMFKGVRAAGRPIIASDKVLGKDIDDVLKDDYRMPTVTECERFQGLPDGYTSGASKTQALKALGNGWQVGTVAHILKGLPIF
jgi:site-specific DNA-cytosine methylase